MPAPLHRWNALNEVFFDQWAARDFTTALATAEEALALARAAFGPRHPTVVQSLLDLSMVQQSAGDPAGLETERTAQELLEALRKESAAEPASAAAADLLLFEADRLWNLVGDKPEVIEKYQQAVAVRTGVLGPEHAATAQATARLAEIEDLRANFAAAETLYRRAVTTFEHSGECEDPYVIKALAGLGRVLLHLDRPIEAWPPFARAVQLADAQGYERRPRYFLLMGAAECRRLLQDIPGAAAYETRALALLSKANPGAEGFHV